MGIDSKRTDLDADNSAKYSNLALNQYDLVPNYIIRYNLVTEVSIHYWLHLLIYNNFYFLERYIKIRIGSVKISRQLIDLLDRF